MRQPHALKLLRDLLGMARQRKAYWIVPVVMLLLLASVLIVASQSATPFIYTLF